MQKCKHTGWEVRGSLGILMLDNPPENYLGEPEFVTLETLEGWLRKDTVKGMIICGAGRHFSAGARLDDLFKLAGKSSVLAQEIARGKEVLQYIENLDIPVIAAIRGACFGAGLEIALAAHIRVCADNALFAFPETNHGLMPGLGGTARITRTVRFADSMKLVLEGDVINASQALEIKLCDHIVPGKEVMDYSISLMNKMTEDRDLKVINYVVRALRNSRDLPFAEAMREESRMFCELAAEEAERRGIRLGEEVTK
jgi:enoyl-CoA hydratase/carnithine racemase